MSKIIKFCLDKIVDIIIAIIIGGGAMSFAFFDNFPSTFIYMFALVAFLIGLMIRNQLKSKIPNTKPLNHNITNLTQEDKNFLKFKKSIFSNIEIIGNNIYFKNLLQIDLNHHTGCGILALQRVKLDYLPIKVKTIKLITSYYHHTFSGFKVIIKQNTKEIELKDFGEFEIVLSDDYDVKTSSNYQYFEYKIKITDDKLNDRIPEDNFGLSTLLNMKIKSIQL